METTGSEATAGALAAGGAMGIMLVFLAIMLIPAIFFCLTLSKTLGKCAPQNREMAPGMVWLLFVPLLNIVWQFLVVIKVAGSLAKEFQARNLALDNPAPGKTIGLAMCIAGICGVIPVVNFIAGPAALICWIVYWVKIAGYSKQLV